MKDQAANLRHLAEEFFRGSESRITGPRTIAVTSGKGGVGKSNVAVNMAVQLGKMGKRVVILDADLGLANAEVLLGIIPAHSIHDVFTGDLTIEEIVVDGPHNIKLIPGGSGLQEIGRLEEVGINRIQQELQRFVDDYDYFFIDTGAGISRSVLGFVAAAQEVIVVTTPEPTSITDAYSMIKILSVFKIHSAVNLVVNKAANHTEAAQTRNKIDAVAARYLKIRINHLGTIFEDSHVAKAVRCQTPFVTLYPYSQAAGDIYRIACRLLNINGQKTNTVNRLITRLSQLFW